MLDRDWNGSFFGECCNCPTVTSALKQPKRIDRMLFIAPQPLQAARLHPLPLSLPPSFLPSMHALASKISKEKAGLAGPHRAFAASRSLALEIFLIPAQIPSFFNLPIHSSSSSSSSSSPLIAESSSAFLPTSSVILVPQPRRPNTLKWANIASALAVCAVTEEELLQLACATDGGDVASSPLLFLP